MKDLDAYLAFIESLVRHSGAVDEQLTYFRFAPNEVQIVGVIVFADGSRLEFVEYVVQASGRISRPKYRYHYMRGGRTVFRYDNAPHHPHLSTFPYHKHDVQGRVLESPPVSLKEVLAEIARLLEKNHDDGR